MIAAGATVEVIAAAWKAEMAAQEKAIEAKRAKDADRQRRHRESRDVTVTNAESCDSPAPLTPPLKVSPDPFKITPPISPHPIRRGTRLPDNFETPGAWIDWAAEKRGWPRAEAREEAECFARYWQAKSGKEAVKLDWFKTWQNWVTNSRRRGGDASDGWSVLA
jgi:hypothetical protein